MTRDLRAAWTVRAIYASLVVALGALAVWRNPMVRIARSPFGVSPASGLVAIALLLLAARAAA